MYKDKDNCSSLHLFAFQRLLIFFQGHPVIDYRVSVSRARKPPTNNERVMAAGLSKMLRRFSIDTTSTHAKQNKPNFVPEDTY